MILLVAVTVLVVVVVGLLTLQLTDEARLAVATFLAIVRLGRGLASAESAVDQDHREARRAMNDAAGQSWRNLGE